MAVQARSQAFRGKQFFFFKIFPFLNFFIYFSGLCQIYRRKGFAGTYNYLSTLSPSASEANLESGFFKPNLVIFDKDGTLVCFHTMWTPWCTSLAQRMNRETGRDMSAHVYDVLGYDHEEKKVRIGALAENTHPQIKDKIEEMLVSQKLEPSHAKEVVNSTWKDTPDDMAIKLTANLPKIFGRLKKEGVKVCNIGLCLFLFFKLSV